MRFAGEVLSDIQYQLLCTHYSNSNQQLSHTLSIIKITICQQKW